MLDRYLINIGLRVLAFGDVILGHKWVLQMTKILAVDNIVTANALVPNVTGHLLPWYSNGPGDAIMAPYLFITSVIGGKEISKMLSGTQDEQG